MASNQTKKISPANDAGLSAEPLSPLSKELVIGVVGYVGAGCSTAAKRLHLILAQTGYTVHKIRLSQLIEQFYPSVAVPKAKDGLDEGVQRLARASMLQDLGDSLRAGGKGYALASLAIKDIKSKRGSAPAGETRIAYIIESVKHPGEVELLRNVYDQSFRLIAVHCDKPIREKRLIGGALSQAKYAGADPSEVAAFMARDEQDTGQPDGQQVREAFYLADYFIDNNTQAADGANLTSDLQRFCQLLLGTGLVRPTLGERAMYHAYAASLQSSCLSRQVGAALVSQDGELVATGTNDVPRYGGGIYSEGAKNDSRCHSWRWTDGHIEFVGCHNDRRKGGLRQTLATWMGENLAVELAAQAHPKPVAGLDTAAKARAEAEQRIKRYLESTPDLYSGIPGIKDLIEFSRAIHAEMDALLSAARTGTSPVGSSLYCTTYPCHSCARHMVTSGVRQVFYIEPYVKSLATDLHSDAITSDPPPSDPQKPQQKMSVTPFTGVGPKMYADFFAKRSDLKAAGGAYDKPSANLPSYAVRLRDLPSVEERAADLI